MASNAFDKLLQISDKLNYLHNSQAAVFKYNDLADSADVKVIFEAAKEVITLQGDTEIVTRRPVAFIDMAQLKQRNLPMPKVRDQFEIDQVIYDIVATPNDGHNEIECYLEKE